jgi:cytochrome c oxidase subunit 3
MSIQAETHVDHHSSTGLDSRKLAMWAFLGSECMFFGSLIVVMLINKDNTLGLDADHFGQGALDLALTSVTTFVLLTSSLAMVLALAAFRNGALVWGRIWLGVVIGFGVIFLGGQVFEFTSFVREGLTPSTNQFGAAFFTLVGFHGAHVAIGVLWLGVVVGYSFRGRFQPGGDMWGIEMVGLYWHFVDLVWVGIFTLIYLI